jgi:UMF1 family MFS transporter
MNKRILAWTLYDFANSTYSAVIAAVIFPVYYATVIVGNSEGLGDLWWGRAISLSMFLVAVSSPFLGGISDVSGRRKTFLMFFTLGAIVAVSLFRTLEPGMVLYGFILIVIANTCVEGGFVFYNSYLPVIAERKNFGKVSSLGYGVGYGGSIISLLIALFLINRNAINLVWFEVAILFALFSLPLFLIMPSDTKERRISDSAIRGMRQTVETIKRLFSEKDALLFLIAYFLYTDGVNTVIVFSGIFAVTTLGFTDKEIIMLFLAVQFFALLGAFSISFLMDKWGSKRVVQSSLIVWIAVSILAYHVQSKTGFFLIASMAGCVLGTIQAASRALYALFVPHGREAEFFGVYSTVGKTSSILGPLLFGMISEIFRNQRPAVLSVAILFIVGLVFLHRVDNRKAH